MATRIYVDNLHKELMISTAVLGKDYKPIKFVGGLYETDDPILQGHIESLNAFGSSIHWQDDIEVMAQKAHQDAEEAAATKARRRRELLDELGADEDYQAQVKAKAQMDEESREKARKEGEEVGKARARQEEDDADETDKARRRKK